MACQVTLSYYLVDALVKHLTNQATFTPPATLYAALFITSPGQNNTGTEVSTAGTGYVRQPVVWTVLTNHQSTNSAVITFPTAIANWGTVAFVALYDAVANGNLIAFAQMPAAVTINKPSVFQINLNQLVLSFQ